MQTVSLHWLVWLDIRVRLKQCCISFVDITADALADVTNYDLNFNNTL